MRRLDRAIEYLTNRGYRADPDAVIERLERRLAGIDDPVVVALPRRSAMSESTSFLRRWRGLLITGSALVIALAVALPMLLLGGGGDDVVSELPTTAAPSTTVAPVTTSTTVPETTTSSDPTTTTTLPPPTIPPPSWESGAGWSRVEAEAFAGVGLDAVIARGERLVAFGWNGFAWVSDDGVSWEGPHPALPSWPHALAVGDDGFVAAVFDPGGIGIWSSSGGVAWEEAGRITLGPDGFVPGEDQRLALARGSAGWVLAGVVCPAGPVDGWPGAPSCQPAVWRSADLASWQRVPAAETGLSTEIRDGRPADQIVALVATGDGYLGAGSILPPGSGERQPAFFRSADGGEWDLDAAIEDFPGEVFYLQAGAGGLVAVAEAASVESFAVFGSPDGETWELLRQQTMFPPGADAFHNDLAVSGDWIAVAGTEVIHGGPEVAVVLMSPDGSTWSLIEAEEAPGIGEMRAIVPYRSGFAAVGLECAPDAGDCDGRVWLWSEPGG